ncbi:phospholipase D family protein [Patulibacter brassicae]|jgi:hypothetical protein|uniref:Phospholipase D family protein n=1 Tax=Patulibacter brassicae TaxID=1705717 RepID=A0ABU4VK53_9ACTN|nr:phospholipase D family protein [Patulibacter brassicae]MDX8151248.1 phospholipase D family protein [Patulibacter brassicae]
MDYELLDRGWAEVLTSPLKADRSNVRVVSPFIKTSAARRLLKSGLPAEIRVITRFSLVDFASGVSDLTALRVLREAGARIRGVRGLHTKLYLPTPTFAVVTSANLTEAGLSRNRELGVASRDPSFVQACSSYFESLWNGGGEDLSFDQIDAWEATIERVWAQGAPPDLRSPLPDFGSSIASDDVAAGGDNSSPPIFAESPRAWVKFFGEGTNRESRATPVLDEVRRSGCHWSCTYPAKRRPVSVRNGDTMFLSRLVRDPDDIVVFGRAIGMAYVPGRDDASPTDIAERPWREQWSRYIRVHNVQLLDGALGGGASLNALMSDLGPDSFRVTQHNAIGGGNTEPRRAYRQQPAVELSAQGHAWMSAALEERFALSGTASRWAMAALDWPIPPAST